MSNTTNQAETTSWPFEQFGEYITTLRDNAGLSNDAALARAASLDASLISNWRSGKQQPSRRSLNKLAPILNVPPVNLWLMAGLADQADLDLSTQPDLTVLPAEYRDLLDLDRDPHMTEEDRTQLRGNVAVVVAGWRARLNARSSSNRPRSTRKAG